MHTAYQRDTRDAAPCGWGKRTGDLAIRLLERDMRLEKIPGFRQELAIRRGSCLSTPRRMCPKGSRWLRRKRISTLEQHLDDQGLTAVV